LKFEIDDSGMLHAYQSLKRFMKSDMLYHMGDKVRIGPDFTISNIE